MDNPDKTGEELASTEIIIARARYSIKAKSVGEWIKFPVSAMTVFEKGNQDIMDRTLVLTASPSLFEATAN
jgi:hypothetical protein